jgi:hypothetical protein
MTLPETHDCRSCGREAALDAERCPCGAGFDPLLRASEAALESLEHNEYVVLEKGISEDPTESGYRRSRLGKPKGQNNDYRLSAAFFEEEKKEEAKETEEGDRKGASVDGVSASHDLSIPSLGSVSLRSLEDIEIPSFDDVNLPSFGGDEESEKKDERSHAGTERRELHLREYEDRYTLHWDAHPATSPMHAVRDAPDYGAACLAAVGLAAAAVGSRVVKRRKE